MLHILSVNRVCSPAFMDYVFRTSLTKPGQSGQKFHRLLAEGFAMHTGECRIETLSTIPVTPASHKRRVWCVPSEREGNLVYHYVPFINVPVVKNILIFLLAFLKTAVWALKGGRKNKFVICDILTVSISSAALLACKMLGVRAVAIVTDLPHLQVVGACQGFKRRFRTAMIKTVTRSYDGYILLTEQMNAVVNEANKPWMVMEGLVDVNMTSVENRIEDKPDERIVMYAGEIYEEYGIKTLIEAFMRLKGDQLRLHIYGNGRMAEEMPHYTQADPRVIYFGMVENSVVVQGQLRATLLVNPRRSTEELTKYSFPSKNVESMVSGTPLVTTPLPGMPQEYFSHVYIFDDETVEGMQRTLDTLLSKPMEELHAFGSLARQFVLNRKNNRIQSDRIRSFLSTAFNR